MVPSIVKQTWIATAVLANGLNQGMILSYPSCLIPALMADDSSIKINLDIASWLASIMAIFMMIGVVGSAFLMNFLGRRLSNGIMIIPGIVGSLLIYYASNVTMLMIGRILCGISNSAGYSIGCCVMGEYTTPKYRGIFLNLKTVTFCMGITIMHIMGGFYHWRTISLINTIPLIFAFLNNCTWTESPSWLAFKGEFKKSEEVFFWLRGTNEDSIREFEAMIQAQKERLAISTKRINVLQKFKSFMKKFTDRTFIKPICVQLAAHVLLECGGRHLFPVYASTIMDSVFHDQSKSFIYTLCIDIITVVGNSVSCMLTPYFRRRTILLSSGLICTLLLIAISSYGFLISSGVAGGDNPWVMATLLIVFFIVANFGITSIPLVLFGEIFPLEHKESCVVVASTISSIHLFVILKVAPYLFATIQVYGVFLVLAIKMVISLIYIYFGLPETSHRTLQEIEEFFSHGKFLDKEGSIYGADSPESMMMVMDTKSKENCI